MVNKVREVFTKEYKRETRYQEFMERMVHVFELNNKSENIDDKIKRLKDKDFVSEFSIDLGEYK